MFPVKLGNGAQFVVGFLYWNIEDKIFPLNISYLLQSIAKSFQNGIIYDRENTDTLGLAILCLR